MSMDSDKGRYSRLGRNFARAKLIETGEIMRVHLYPVRRVASSRAKKEKVSRPVQAALNRRRSENRAKDIAHLNFRRGDGSLRVRLDYFLFRDKLGRNPTEEEAKKLLAAYLRVLRREYKKGGEELLWMQFSHLGKKSGTVHHHLILSAPPKGMRREDIERLWSYGYGNVTSLVFRNGSIAGYIDYSFAGMNGSWSCSKNCKRPSTEVYDDGSPASVRIRDDFCYLKDARYIDDNPDDLAFIRAMFPGYEISYVRKTPEAISLDGGLAFIPFSGPFIEIELYRSDCMADERESLWHRFAVQTK